MATSTKATVMRYPAQCEAGWCIVTRVLHGDGREHGVVDCSRFRTRDDAAKAIKARERWDTK